MRRNIAFLTITFALMAGLFYMGIPKPLSPIRALRVSRAGASTKPAWSNSGERLARPNAGHVFIHDLSRYMYNDPRITKPVLVGDIRTPGIDRLEWSPDDKLLLAQITTYDIFNSHILVDLKTERLRTLEIDSKRGMTADFFFWRSTAALGAVVGGEIDTPYPQGRLAIAELASGEKRSGDNFLNSDSLLVRARELGGIDMPSGYEIEYDRYFRDKYLLGWMRKDEGPADFFALDTETGKANVLGAAIEDISVADTGRAVVLLDRAGPVRLAEISNNELKVGESVTFEDRWGQQLRPTKISISPNGRFIAFEHDDPFASGIHVAPLP